MYLRKSFTDMQPALELRVPFWMCFTTAGAFFISLLIVKCSKPVVSLLLSVKGKIANSSHPLVDWPRDLGCTVDPAGLLATIVFVEAFGFEAFALSWP